MADLVRETVSSATLRRNKALSSRDVRVDRFSRKHLRPCRVAAFYRLASETTTRPSWPRESEDKRARNGRIESPFERRLVVVWGAKEPMKWALLAMRLRPESKFAGSLAEQAGFEPQVAVQ